MPFDYSAEPPRCRCDSKTLYRRRLANDVVIVGMACPICGSWGAVPKKAVSEIEQLPWYDEGIRDEYWKQRHERQLDVLAEKRVQRDAQFFEEHSRYLHSPAWLRRREMVLKRAGHTCEACLSRRATEVHHVTYEHWQNEPLFDLRAVCHSCHEDITEMDRARRSKP
jgi:hypothetical protein